MTESSSFARIEIPDLDGGMRSKLTREEKGLSRTGNAFCQILFGLTVDDDVYTSQTASFENGFPDFLAIADMETLRTISWHGSMPTVICDLYESTGELSPIAPRTALRRVCDRYATQGLTPRMAMEFEVYVFHADDSVLRSGEATSLQSWGRTHNAYSFLRASEYRQIADVFASRLDELGITLEAFHSELGFGAIEFTIGHLPALQAADAALRAKMAFKELCADHGLVATFMAKINMVEPGCGGHIHQSVWRDGANAFSPEDDEARGRGELSSLGARYAAGQLATMSESSVFFNPTMNSYRRIDAQMWSPENSSWGFDNRTAALRVITEPSSSAVRIEHRRPGADVSPHLAMAAMLAGGLLGIEQEMPAPAYAVGNAAEDGRFSQLPSSLSEATDALELSAFARASLSDEFVDHYVLSRRQEIQAWDSWLRDHVTPWEIRRYFEAI